MVSLLILALAGASPAAAVDKGHAQPIQAQGKDCPRTTSIHAFDRSKPLTLQKLGELPPANAYKAVYRLVGGCEVPVVVRYGIGGR